MIGRLVQQQHVGLGQQQAAQSDAAFFTAGENTNHGVPGRQAQSVGSDFELVLGVRTAGGDDGFEFGLFGGQGVKVCVRFTVSGVNSVKASLGSEHGAHAGFNAFAHGVRVIELGFLRQVTDVQVRHGGGFALDLGVDAGHDFEQGRLAGTVGAQHADLGAGEKTQRHILQDLPLRRHGLRDLVHGENVLGHQGSLLKKGGCQKAATKSRTAMPNHVVVIGRITRLSFHATIHRSLGSSTLRHLGIPTLTELCF